MQLRKAMVLMTDASWIEWQEAFTLGRAVGSASHKGKSDKLKDGQLKKFRPSNLSENAAAGWEAGFNFGWDRYRPTKKKSKKTSTPKKAKKAA